MKYDNKQLALGYAINRINQYNSLEAKVGELKICKMCAKVKASCTNCPFYNPILKLTCSDDLLRYDNKGRKARTSGIGYKTHQEILIQRTLYWCRENMTLWDYIKTYFTLHYNRLVSKG